MTNTTLMSALESGKQVADQLTLALHGLYDLAAEWSSHPKSND